MRLNKNLCEINEIKQFVKKLKKYMMGDLIEPQINSTKPVQIIPFLDRNHKSNKRLKIFDNNEILKYLKEITFYLNSICDHKCKLCSIAFKQSISCFKNKEQNFLKYEAILKLMDETKILSLLNFNISGGNILKYQDFIRLLKLLKEYRRPTTFYVNYKNFYNNYSTLNYFKNILFTLNILITFPIHWIALKNLVFHIKQLEIKFLFQFIISSYNELKIASDVISELDIKFYGLVPCYDKSNLLFFKKFVFFDIKKLINSGQSIRRFFMKEIINEFYFGKITLMPNGNIHSNINKKCVGNIYKNSIHETIYKVLADQKSWLLTRGKINPCKNCLYYLLCPSISNYDEAIGQYNLCNIHKSNLFGGACGAKT
jgi:pseudo-rSAM protein